MPDTGMARKLVVAAATISLSTIGFAMPFYFGMGTHVGQNRMNDTEAFSIYKLGGFNSLRDESFWHRVEIEKGQLEFPKSLTDLDRLVNRTSNAGGSPMIVLDYSNIYYDLGDIPETDTGLAGFKRYAAFTALHYKGRAPLYEVWNEWNIGLGSNRKPRTIRSVDTYIRLLRSTIEAVLSVDAGAKLIAGAVAGQDDKWIDEFIAKGGVKGIDGFSVHPYVYQRPSQNRPEDASEWLARLNSKLTAANQGPVDIYVTEIGWPNHQGKTGWTEQQTADFVLRFHLLVKAQPAVRGVWWYELRDGGDDPAEKEHHFGLLGKDLHAKPAFKALKVAISLLPDSGKVSISEPAKGVYKASISVGIEQCSAYWSREGQKTFNIPDQDLVGRLVWGSRPGADAVITETPVVTCRPGP